MGKWVFLCVVSFYNLWFKISLFRKLGPKQNYGDSSHTDFKISLSSHPPQVPLVIQTQAQLIREAVGGSQGLR